MIFQITRDSYSLSYKHFRFLAFSNRRFVVAFSFLLEEILGVCWAGLGYLLEMEMTCSTNKNNVWYY